MGVYPHALSEIEQILAKSPIKLPPKDQKISRELYKLFFAQLVKIINQSYIAAMRVKSQSSFDDLSYQTWLYSHSKAPLARRSFMSPGEISSCEKKPCLVLAQKLIAIESILDNREIVTTLLQFSPASINRAEFGGLRFLVGGLKLISDIFHRSLSQLDCSFIGSNNHVKTIPLAKASEYLTDPNFWIGSMVKADFQKIIKEKKIILKFPDEVREPLLLEIEAKEIGG